MFGVAHGPPKPHRVSRGPGSGYDAGVLEIRVDQPEGSDYLQIAPEGELDAYSVAQFRESFAKVGANSRLVVNLSGVQFMDSAGLGALIGGIRKIRDNDGSISVFCDRATITRLLHTTGFDRIVPVCETLDEAVSALDQ
jgi:anti-sigma B factor antagonist